MEKVLTKIRDIRKEKGFTLESMADELEISHTAYRNIENSQSKLTVERLIGIAEILEVPTSELLDEKATYVYNQTNNNNGTVIGHQDFENYYYQENKELMQNYMESLKAEIEFLKSLLSNK